MSLNLNIFPVGNNESNAPFIGQIEINENEIKKLKNNNDKTKPVNYFENNVSNQIETIIILDTSASMGKLVNKTIRDYIPKSLKKLGYKLNDVINLITFSSYSNIYKLTLNDMKSSKLTYEECTYMAEGINNLKTIITKSLKNNQNKQFRIIAISDGALHDQENTIKKSSELALLLKEYQNLISTTAFRMFTSSSQPDTRGLTSILRLNTNNDAKLIDIDFANYEYSDEIVSDIISSSIKDDLGLNTLLRLNDNDDIFLSWS